MRCQAPEFPVFPKETADCIGKGGERMSKGKCGYGYTGRIGNAGSQKVEAPFGRKSSAKGTVTKAKNDKE